MNKTFGVHPDVLKLGLVSFLTDVSSEMIFSVFAIFFTAIAGASSALLGLVEGLADFSASSLDYVAGFLEVVLHPSTAGSSRAGGVDRAVNFVAAGSLKSQQLATFMRRDFSLCRCTGCSHVRILRRYHGSGEPSSLHSLVT